MACELLTLTEDGKCFECLSDIEKKRAFLYLLAKALNAVTEEDLTTPALLQEAVKCWCVADSTLLSFKAVVARDLAVTEGAFETTPTMDEVMEALKCWCDVSDSDAGKMEALLLCKLLDHYS